MALVQFSALVDGIRGKSNGSQFNSTRAGYVLQKKCSQRKGATQAQSAQRASFAYLSKFWRTLTPEQQQANNDASVNYPYTDRFGNTRYYTGNVLLLRSNLNLAQSGLPPIAEVPFTPPVAPVAELSDFLATVSGSVLGELFWSLYWTGISAGQYSVQFFYSDPASAGVTNYTGKLYFAGSMDLTDSDFYLNQSEIQNFGSWQIGLKMFTSVYVVDNASGIVVLSFNSSYIISN